MTAMIRRFVECESPSGDAAAVNRFVELVADTVAGSANVRTAPAGRFGKILTCEMALPGKKKTGAKATTAKKAATKKVATARPSKRARVKK